MIRLTTRERLSGFLFGLLALMTCGCSGSPLVGHWTRSTSTPGRTGTATLTLAADGSGSFVVAVPGCTGMWTNGDWTWSTSGTTLTIAGSYDCTGSITCGGVVLQGCNRDTSVMNTACEYALSDNENSLALTACLGSSTTSTMTFTRAM